MCREIENFPLCCSSNRVFDIILIKRFEDQNFETIFMKESIPIGWIWMWHQTDDRFLVSCFLCWESFQQQKCLWAILKYIFLRNIFIIFPLINGNKCFFFLFSTLSSSRERSLQFLVYFVLKVGRHFLLKSSYLDFTIKF